MFSGLHGRIISESTSAALPLLRPPPIANCLQQFASSGVMGWVSGESGAFVDCAEEACGDVV